jgi:uncharacterized protein (DUF1684 family)
MTAFLLALSACVAQEGAEEAAYRPTDTEAVPEDEASVWEAGLLRYRERKDNDFQTSATSPMAALQDLVSETPWETIYLTRKEKTFGLRYFPPVPNSVLMIVKEPDGWHWYDQGLNVVCIKDGREMPNGASAEDPAIFFIEGFTVDYRPREYTVALRVFDPERPQMKSFKELEYFPPDDHYVVHARFTPFAEPEEVELPTSENGEQVFYRRARIEFELEGVRRELTAFQTDAPGEIPSVLFIPFKDRTTGRETYGGGRVLEIEVPSGEHFELDFNRASDPLCSYSPAYECPIPPPENELDVAIRAGEKNR